MKKNSTFSHFKLIVTAVLLMAFYAAKATFVPVIIPTSGPNGFNADVVADSAPPVQQPPYLPGENWATKRTTATFDASLHYLVATGFKRDTFTSNPFVLPALPTNRQIISTPTPNLFWNLAPYNGNNSIRMTLAQSVTINVNPATYIGDVYILGASTGGATTVNITVTFVGGTTQVLNSQSFADWMNGNPYEMLGVGRVIKATALGDLTLGGTNPRFYSVKVPLTNANFSKQIASITITRLTSTTVLNILAITIDDQSTCLPVINNPTVQPSSIGLREARLIITPPVSSAAGFVTPQNYQWVATGFPTPPSPVVGGSTFTLSGTTPTDTVHVTGLQSGTQYYFHIRTDCGGGSYSLWRTSAIFTTLTCSNTSATVTGINMTQATINITAPAQSGAVLPGMTNATYGYQWIFDTNAGDPIVPPGSPTQMPLAGPLPIPPVGPWTTLPFPTVAQPHPQTGLNAATTYYFHHRKTCVGDTANSKWVNTPVPTLACPLIPANPTITAITTVSAVVRWNLPPVSSNPSVGYDWAVTTSNTTPTSWNTITIPPPPPLPPGSPATLAFHDTVKNLIPQTQYYLHVRNRCSGNFNAVWNTPIGFLTQNCPNGTMPQATAIVSNVPGAITVKWNGTSVPGHHEYHYALQIASLPAPTSWVATFDTFAILPNATYPVYPGVAYKFWMRGNCTITNAPWLSVNVTNPFPLCLSPIGMGITNVNMHGAAITWTNGFNGIGYQYALTAFPNSNPPANGTYTTDTFHNATNLSPITKYYVHVRTHCNTTPIGPVLTNYSTWIKDSFTTTATCLVPNITATAPHITNVTSHSAQIMWNFYPGLYGYEFLLNTDPNTPTISGLPINYNGYYPINLSSGTTYYLHIRTRCDTVNYSPWVTVSFQTDPLCNVAAPQPAVSHTDTKASFTWPGLSNAIRYEYQVSQSATPPAGGSNQFTTVTNQNVTGLLPQTHYWFHLRAACSDADQTAWETIDFVTWPLAVGNINGNSEFGLDVHPNPATDVLYVDITGRHGGTARIQIVDMSGKIVETFTVNKDKAEINTSKLSAGMYLLKYVDSENAGVIRIEKQ